MEKFTNKLKNITKSQILGISVVLVLIAAVVVSITILALDNNSPSTISSNSNTPSEDLTSSDETSSSFSFSDPDPELVYSPAQEAEVPEIVTNEFGIVTSNAIKNKLAGYSFTNPPDSDGNSYSGLLDPSGQMILPAEYTTIGATVGENDLVPMTNLEFKAVFVDIKTGATVLKTDYAAASHFKNGAASVCKNPEDTEKIYVYNYIDKAGKTLRDGDNLVAAKLPASDSSNLALAQSFTNSLYGYVGEDYQWVIEPVFTNAGAFSQGLAPAADEEKWGIIDTTGKWVVEPKYELAGNIYSEGLMRVATTDKWGFIDTQGNVVIEEKFDNTINFQNGCAAVAIDGLTTYINKDGEYLFEPTYIDAYAFSSGMARVKIMGNDDEERLGYINADGKLVIDAIYDGGSDFYDGIASVNQSGRYYFIDKEGNILFDNTSYDYAGDFINGQAIVCVNGLYGVIDKNGDYVIEPQYYAMDVITFAE